MIDLKINGKSVSVEPGTTVAAAVMNMGETRFRRSVKEDPRAPLCGMGICFECRLKINGATHQRSCNVVCENGMEVETDA